MEEVDCKSIHKIMNFSHSYRTIMAKFGFSASINANKVITEGCQCKCSTKIGILSRVLGASQRKQVGVSRVQTREIPT